MIEKIYNYSTEDTRAVEQIIMDDNLNYIHMVFNKEEGLPVHMSNSNVYMTIIRGTLSIKLGQQEIHEYKKGEILQIPYGVEMDVKNFHNEVLELIVVKAPASKNYKK